MGVFTRFKDIVSSNLNALLDKAEDPEKMIRMMIQEMEETLVEMKAGCASQIADRARLQRQLVQSQSLTKKWDERAEMAVQKGRDDLAKEAILESQKYLKSKDEIAADLGKFEGLIDKSQEDIIRLEEKIVAARKKQRLMVQRAARAATKYNAESSIRRSTSADAAMKFEQYEKRIDRMEAAADLVNPRRDNTLDDEFAKLEHDEKIEDALAKLKAKVAGQSNQ